MFSDVQNPVLANSSPFTEQIKPVGALLAPFPSMLSFSTFSPRSCLPEVTGIPGEQWAPLFLHSSFAIVMSTSLQLTLAVLKGFEE